MASTLVSQTREPFQSLVAGAGFYTITLNAATVPDLETDQGAVNLAEKFVEAPRVISAHIGPPASFDACPTVSVKMTADTIQAVTANGAGMTNATITVLVYGKIS